MPTILEYACLARDVYADKKSPMLANWHICEFNFHPDQEFYARLYLNNLSRESVISYRGTTNGKNLITDAELTARIYNSQDDNAKIFYKKAMSWLHSEENKGYSKLPSLTGHSLGGYFATLIAAENPAHIAVVFNAPGIGGLRDRTLKTRINLHKPYLNIYNFNVDTDDIHLVGAQIGRKYTLHGHNYCSHKMTAIIIFVGSETILSSPLAATVAISHRFYCGAIHEHGIENVLWALGNEPPSIQNKVY